MPYVISKEFRVSCAHWIAGLPEWHQCGRLHGHNYRIQIVLASESLDDTGFVRDYGDFGGDVKHYLDHFIDHRNLNEIMEHDQTTAENFARFLYSRFASRWPELIAVRVSETDTTWACYSPDGRGCW